MGDATTFAEELLYRLALQLRSMPFDRGMHLRALQLKREVRAWETTPPDASRVDAVLDEIRSMLVRKSVPPPSEAA
ncbi:MAG TPA: hypothetical protein VIF62_24535 [Labilithrix sp.]|jgi:hypothetical protein